MKCHLLILQLSLLFFNVITHSFTCFLPCYVSSKIQKQRHGLLLSNCSQSIRVRQMLQTHCNHDDCAIMCKTLVCRCTDRPRPRGWPPGRDLFFRLRRSEKPGKWKRKEESASEKGEGKIKMDQNVLVRMFYYWNPYAVFFLSSSSAVWPEVIFFKAVPYKCTSVIILPFSTLQSH